MKPAPSASAAPTAIGKEPAKSRPSLAELRALGKALRRPVFMVLPAFALKAALGDLAKEIFLGSQFVRPARAWQSGFRFNDVRLLACLERLVGAPERVAPLVALKDSKSDPASVSR